MVMGYLTVSSMYFRKEYLDLMYKCLNVSSTL